MITGGSRGLGLAIAERFASEGAQLVLCARSERQLERAREQLEEKYRPRVTAIPCDITNRAKVAEMFGEIITRYGRIDVVVNNAGIIQVGPIEAMDELDFRTSMETNFWGTVNVTMEALPHLLRRKGPRIINITSIGGTVAVPHLLPYTAAKFAAVGFSEGLQVELARHGVFVTTVVPGLMRTGSFINALFKGRKQAEAGWFSIGATLPLLTVSAEKAATRIVEACRNREAYVVIGTPAKALRIAHHLFPGLTSRAFILVNGWLPQLGEFSHRKHLGRNIKAFREAPEKWNEKSA